MTLVKSISGIRGTIGGLNDGENLTPFDIIQFASAYSVWLKEEGAPKKVVIGRDARISGEIVNGLVVNTLLSMGIDVIDLGLSTTPTVEMAVVWEKAGGGIILTASHNPKQWNALKMLTSDGEFLNHQDASKVLSLVKENQFDFVDVTELGKYTKKDGYIDKHIQTILDHKYVDVEAIKQANFSILVDGVNSSGGVFIPQLLKALGVETIYEVNCEPTGVFAHNPEPLAENLVEVSKELVNKQADLGIVVDPDVDRLAFINEDGTMFGEEYTLVAVADYVLGQAGGGNTVSNLSSTISLRTVTEKHGGTYNTSAVGELNVVTKMKETNAIIGGEGNGGVIYTDFHYGRDALVGIGLFLSHLAKSNKKSSELRATYPQFTIVKQKIAIPKGVQVDKLIENVAKKYSNLEQNREDGLKIYFEEGTDWVHLRKSNTEPIVRVYAESDNEEKATSLANKMRADFNELLND